MSLKIKIDTASIAATFKELALEVEQDLKQKVEVLAKATHLHVLTNAKGTLSSPTFQKFSKSVHFDDPAPGLWIVSISEEGLWVEEGIEANHNMKPDLLKDATHTSKDGNKYKAVPFDHGKGPSQMTPLEAGLANEVKAQLKARNIPFKKLEKDAQGKPIHGGTDASGKPIPKLMHRLDFGREGATMNWLHKKNEGHPLKGLSIYQTLTKSGNVRRDILTFRTVSGGPASAGKWIHPGYEAKKFLDEAQEWAEREWERTILPEVLAKWK